MPEDVFRRHDNCDCRTIFENGRERQDVWSKRSWEVPETGPGAESPAVFTEEQAKAIEQRNLQQFRGVKINNSSIDISSRNGIINSVTITDFVESDPKGIISSECKETIIKVLEEQDSLHLYDEIKIVKISAQNGLIEPMRTNTVYRPGYPKVVLEINEAAFVGKTLEDINTWFELQKYSTINSLREAVIHETAHAKVIDGLTYEQYEDINRMLSGSFFTKADIGKKSLKSLAGEISEYAQKDGLECIAESHVKLLRGEKIPDELKRLHDMYVK